jgi:hypothetical protein
MSAHVPSFSVREMLRSHTDLSLELLAGEGGLDRRITVPRIQKPGLALAGFVEQVHPERVQILGSTELGYLKSLPVERARSGIAGFLRMEPACVIVTKGQDVPEDLLNYANETRVPILRTPMASSMVIDGVEQGSVTTRPLPLQRWQGATVTTWPRKLRCTRCTWPTPLHSGHVDAEVPLRAPEPEQVGQLPMRFSLIFLDAPWAISSSVSLSRT